MLMDILGIEDRSGLRFHQNCGFRSDRRPLRPPLRFVALDLFILSLLGLRVVIYFLFIRLFLREDLKRTRCQTQNTADQ